MYDLLAMTSLNFIVARSCFQFWPKIGDEGVSRDSFFLEILSPSEPILRAKIENMISPDYVYVICPKPMDIEGKFRKFWTSLKILDFFWKSVE